MPLYPPFSGKPTVTKPPDPIIFARKTDTHYLYIMIELNLTDIATRIFRDTLQTARFRTVQDKDGTVARSFEERIFSLGNEDEEHDASFPGDGTVRRIDREEQGLPPGRDILCFSIDKKILLDRIRAEANTKAALMKRPGWTIKLSDTLDDGEDNDEDFTLTSEEIEAIRNQVEDITDKRAALLAKENGKEYADYTLIPPARENDNSLQTFTLKLSGKDWDWQDLMDNELLKRAHAITETTGRSPFSDLAGIDQLLISTARAIPLTPPTLEEAHRETAIRARILGNSDGKFPLRVLDDEASFQSYLREAQAQITALFGQSTEEGTLRLFLSEDDADMLEGALKAYQLDCVLASFYASCGDTQAQQEAQTRAERLLSMAKTFRENQAGGSFQQLKERWREEAITSLTTRLAPYDAHRDSDDTLTLSAYLDSGHAEQATSLLRHALLQNILARFYAAILLPDEAARCQTQAQEFQEEATALFRRQRIHTDASLFTSLLEVAMGDVDLLFARMKNRKTRPMYRSAITLRILTLFYAQVGQADLATLYTDAYNRKTELARNLSSDFSASYTVIQGRLNDGLHQLSDLLAPLQRTLPMPPLNDTEKEAEFRIIQQRAPLSFAAVYALRALAENFLVYFAVSGWLELCGDENAGRDKAEETAAALRRAIAFRTTDADFLLQRLEEAARNLDRALFPYYPHGTGAGFLFDEQRQRAFYDFHLPPAREEALARTAAAYLEHESLADWYRRAADPMCEPLEARAAADLRDALAMAIETPPRPYNPIP